MNKRIKKTVLFLMVIGLCCFFTTESSQPANPNTLNVSSLTPSQQAALAASNANPVAAAQALQQNNINQANYFFSALPQATSIPAAITAEINRVYATGLGLPATIITQIQQFYSMLYLIAEEEALAQTVPSGTLPTQVNVPVPANFTLTGAQLIQSKVWQDYLKIKIGYSYDQELQFLQQIQQNELSTFNYLPQFELNFYQNSFVQLRTISQLTRFYLLMTEQLRQRYLAQCTDWSAIVTSTDPTTALTQRNTLFADIVTFKNSAFYTTTMQFESVDPESTFPLLSSQSLVTSANFPTMFSTINGKLTVLPAYESFFEIDQNGIVWMTGLGSIVYTGYIATPQGVAPSFETTSLFQTLFGPSVQNGVTTMVPTLGYMELLCFSALKALNAEVAYLFQSANLASTLQKIQAIGAVDIPFFIFYQPQDYMFLNEINNLLAPSGPLNNNVLAPGSVVASSIWDSIGDFFTHTIPDAAKSVYNDVLKPFGNTVAHFAEAAGYGIEGLGLDIIVLPACECIDAFAGTNFSAWALSTAQSAQANATQQLSDAMADLKTTMAGIKTVATTLVQGLMVGVAYLTGGILLAFDSNYLSDYVNMFKKIGDAAVDIGLVGVDFVVHTAGESVALTVDAVNALSATVGDVIAGKTSSVGSTWKTFGESIASAVLSSISLVASDLENTLSDAMAAIGYLVSSIVDMIEDVGAGLAAAGEFMLTYVETGNISAAADSASSEFSSAYNAINAHRSLISSIVTTVLVVALTVVTGGAASAFGLAMLTVNVGMMAMNIAGTAQQEQLTVNQIASEGDFVNCYAAYVNSNEVQMSNIASLQAASYQAHTASAVDNQNRTLAFYENWMNDTTNATISTQAYNVGSFYNYSTEYATSSPNGPQASPMVGDPGYVYGIQTGRICLNPGQGFLVYNEGRGTFGQEIAAPASFPQLTALPVDDTGTTPIQTESNWFQLKDLSNIPVGKPLVADIIFRSLYDSGKPFSIGVYLTERSLDIAQMNQLNKNLNAAVANPNGTPSFDKAWAQLDTFNRYLLDYDALAKMFVCYRNEALAPGAALTPGTTPQLGVYVHNTASSNAQNGWLQTPTFAPLNFEQGTWYRMQATLKGTTFKVAFWKADNLVNVKALSEPPATAQVQTFTVDNAVRFGSLLDHSAKLEFEGSMGVIACGAAVEYKVLAPEVQTSVFPARAQINGDLSPTGTTPWENQRESIWQNQLQGALTFPMAPYTLNAYSEPLLIAGQNVYTIVGTSSAPGTLIAGMSTPAGPMTDYVVLGKNVDTNPVLGVSQMTGSPNGFVSLVTGIRYYESSGTMAIKGVVPNILNVYKAQPGTAPLDPTLLGLVQAAQTKYAADTIGQLFTFGNMSLQADAASLANGLYVYKGTTIPGNQVDYYMLSSQTTTSMLLPNQVLSPDISILNFDGMVSLTTNDVFLLQSSSQSGTSQTTPPTSISSFGSLAFNATNPVVTHSLAGYTSQLSATIQSFIATALARQNEASAVTAAQGALAKIGSNSTSGTLYNATSALAAIPSVPTTVSSNAAVVAALAAVTGAKGVLTGDITTIEGLVAQINTAITTANSATAANLPAATTALSGLTTQLNNANVTLGTDTTTLNSVSLNLSSAIANVPPPSAGGTMPAGDISQGFVDPANWCITSPPATMSDNCCITGNYYDCVPVCGTSAAQNPDVSCCLNADSTCKNSDSCGVFGGPGNCWKTSPCCVMTPVAGSAQYAPSPANDNCRIPQAADFANNNCGLPG